MKQIIKTILTKDEQPKTTALRNWQKFRGWTLKILEVLENSGGETTRSISDRTGCKPTVAKVKLQQMLCVGLVEKVEKWGWRITRDGINCLIITRSNNNNNYVNGKLMDGERLVNTKLMDGKCLFPLENQERKEEERLPGCFQLKFCHIKQFSHDKTYNNKTNMHCDGCCWFKSELWIGSQSSIRNVG